MTGAPVAAGALDRAIRESLDGAREALEGELGTDIIAIYSPILSGVDRRLRAAIEGIPNPRGQVTVVLDTPGGIVEVVERMVATLRRHYGEVAFLVPDRAMSAGTIFVMSGDRIYMDYYAVLGPIDPQVEKDGRLVPALSYLTQYERMLEKARAGRLTTADLALLGRLDLAEMHQFEQARELSTSLLKRWLARYKFKNWRRTEGRGLEVDAGMRSRRAEEIARALNDHERWHSHARGIGMDTLANELNIRIEDFGDRVSLALRVRAYHALLEEYRTILPTDTIVHARGRFL